jgi:hypothetical protein
LRLGARAAPSRKRQAVSSWEDCAVADLTNPRLIYLKGFLFLFLGLLAAALLLAECPTLKAALLLAVAVWSFARFYYFAFYFIERYVDPDYRFAGLWSFARYLLRRKRATPPGPPPAGRDTSNPPPTA